MVVEASKPVTDSDDLTLQRKGKQSDLKRNLGIISLVGVSCTVLGTWEGILGIYAAALSNGGSRGTVYRLISDWIGTTTHFLVLGELVSMAPVSGGQYHWAAMLAPPKFVKHLSYTVGWLSLCGWQAAFASSSLLAASMLRGVSFYGNDFSKPKPYPGTLICWVALLILLVLIFVVGKIPNRGEIVLLVLHLLVFLGIIIPLVAMSKHNLEETIVSLLTDGGAFPSMGLSWCIGMSYLASGFGGADGVVYQTTIQEISNAGVIIPQTLILSFGINGLLGFGTLVAMLFYADPDVGGKTRQIAGHPWMAIFSESTQSVAGTQAISAIIVIIYICAIMGLLAAISRQLSAFSRDHAIPGWTLWNQVDSSTVLPIHALLISLLLVCCLAVIRIISDVAVEDIVSMTMKGLYISYLMVTTMLFIRRHRGEIMMYNNSGHEHINVPGGKLVWGPFHVPGVLGTIVNGSAIIHLTFVVIFS